MTRQDFFSTILGAVAVPKVLDLGTPADGKRLFALSFDAFLSRQQVADIQKSLDPTAAEFDCKFLVFDKAVSIQRIA